MLKGSPRLKKTRFAAQPTISSIEPGTNVAEIRNRLSKKG